MDTQLDGKVALVTGASQGIGRAIAMALAGEGAQVALLSRRRSGLDETLALIGRSNGLVVPCDVTDSEAVASAVKRVVATFGGLDVVVNNAGQRGRLARVEELEVTLKNCVATRVYVSAFPDFRQFKRHVDKIAWETEVWIAEIPDHLIHFNGDKFLGPGSSV